MSQTDNPGAVPYGLLWWINEVQEPDYYFAGGVDGQKIVIVNDIDMVIISPIVFDRFWKELYEFNIDLTDRSENEETGRGFLQEVSTGVQNSSNSDTLETPKEK